MKVNRLHPNQIIFCPYCYDDKGFNNVNELEKHVANHNENEDVMLYYPMCLAEDKPFLKFPNIESEYKHYRYEGVWLICPSSTSGKCNRLISDR